MKPLIIITVLVTALAAGQAQMAAQESRQVPPKPDEGVPTAPAGEALNIPTGEHWLGTVRIPVNVLANGEPLPAGRYRVRLTGKIADTRAVGQLAELERWVEFVQGNAVKGRAMAPVVPSRATEQVADARPPQPGRFRVQRLAQDDYVRIWFNLKGDQILIHLPIQPRAAAR
jgi:hypothetical protein